MNISFLFIVSYIAGAVVSTVLEFVPGLSGRWHSLTANGRRVIIVALNLIIGAAGSLLVCHSGLSIPVEGLECGSAGQTVVNALMVMIVSFVGSQSAHKLKKAGG